MPVYAHRQRSVRRRLANVVAILASVMLLALSAVSSSQAHTQPALFPAFSLRAAIVESPADLIAVQGGGFTPGGLVQITVHGNAHAGADRNQWAVATSAGTIDEVISMAPDVTWGPDGSRDPARGYDDPSQGSGDDGHVSVPLCFQNLTVRTLDVRTGNQSTLLEIHATCAVTTGPPVV